MLRDVIHTVPRVGRPYEHYPNPHLCRVSSIFLASLKPIPRTLNSGHQGRAGRLACHVRHGCLPARALFETTSPVRPDFRRGGHGTVLLQSAALPCGI